MIIKVLVENTAISTEYGKGEVKELCDQYGMDFIETSSWYDGYQFKRFKHVYNPRSVVAAMKCGDFSNLENLKMP